MDAFNFNQLSGGTYNFKAQQGNLTFNRLVQPFKNMYNLPAIVVVLKDSTIVDYKLIIDNPSKYVQSLSPVSYDSVYVASPMVGDNVDIAKLRSWYENFEGANAVGGKIILM